MSKTKTAVALECDRTRINPQIPSTLYTRLSLHVGTKPGAISQFCERAIEAELKRVNSQ
jgi:hypothetical protein